MVAGGLTCAGIGNGDAAGEKRSKQGTGGSSGEEWEQDAEGFWRGRRSLVAMKPEVAQTLAHGRQAAE